MLGCAIEPMWLCLLLFVWSCRLQEIEAQQFALQEQDADKEHEQLQMLYGFTDRVSTCNNSIASTSFSCSAAQQCCCCPVYKQQQQQQQ